jgi:serine/threonine protein kinase
VFDKAGPERVPKLIDFGFGKIQSFDSNSTLTTPVGSIGYYGMECHFFIVFSLFRLFLFLFVLLSFVSQSVAPEITKSKESYSLSVDMWSLGCLVYFMLTKQPPFHAATEVEIETRSQRADFQFPSTIEISERGIR